MAAAVVVACMIGRSAAFHSALPIARSSRAVSVSARSRARARPAPPRGRTPARAVPCMVGIPEVGAYLASYAAVGAGTLGASKVIDGARGVLTRSPLVGPEAWRRGIETLPLALGAFFVAAGSCRQPVNR